MAKNHISKKTDNPAKPAKNSGKGKTNEGKGRPTTTSDRTVLRHKDGQNKDNNKSENP